jgi:hypothetical protein
MTKNPADSSADTQVVSAPRPHAPSWVDRFVAGVDRLPGPSWAFYVGLWLFLIVILTTAVWLEGAVLIGPILPIALFMPSMVTLLLAMLHTLGNRAGKALETLRPVLNASEEEHSRLRYRLTTRPARPMLAASLALVGLIAVVEASTWPPTFLVVVVPPPVSAGLFYAVYLIGWWNFGALLYHAVHQLRLINQIYTGHTRINLFRQRPLYAFSSLVALTVVSLAIPTYGWTAMVPPESDALSIGISAGIVALITALAVAAFVWPLLGIHRLLSEEKGRLLDECSLRLEATIAELHQRLDLGSLEGMDGLNDAMASLEIEQTALDRIPTWPWQPETVRLLITALAFPLGLWVIQYVLQLLLAS